MQFCKAKRRNKLSEKKNRLHGRQNNLPGKKNRPSGRQRKKYYAKSGRVARKLREIGITEEQLAVAEILNIAGN
jgi:hypothetical protein